MISGKATIIVKNKAKKKIVNKFRKELIKGKYDWTETEHEHDIFDRYITEFIYSRNN